MTVMFPADRFPGPRMRGKPGGNYDLRHADLYPGCKLLVQVGPCGHTFYAGPSDEHPDTHTTCRTPKNTYFKIPLRDLAIAPDNPESVIGVGECGVSRVNGNIETLLDFPPENRAAIVRNPTGGTVIFVERRDLPNRYAFVGTRSECEAWVEANKPKPKRFTIDDTAKDAIARYEVVLDGDAVVARCDTRVDAELVRDLLNAHDAQRKDTNA